MDGCNFLEIHDAISEDRLAKYVSTCNGCTKNALKLYAINMALCEAFYSPLQCVEVCLRNHLHSAMTDVFSKSWMINGGPVLENDSKDKITEAQESRKKIGKPQEIPDLIAEVRFSFWVGLMGTKYDNTIWRQAIHKAFKNNAKSKKRREIHGRFNAIRRFRNRVAHHEPILNHKPLDKYKEIIEAISWLSIHKAAWTEQHSNVLKILDEYELFKKKLEVD